MLWRRGESKPKVEYEYVLEVEPLVSAEEDVFEFLAAPYEKFSEILAENIQLKWALAAGKLMAYKKAHEIARRRITWLAKNILTPPRELQPPRVREERAEAEEK